MKCKKCGPWYVEVFYHERTKPHGKCVCRKCGATWFVEEHNLSPEGRRENLRDQEQSSEAQFVEIFGFQVPTRDYYLHHGHAWAALEDTGMVRVGLDDFSRKVLGLADELKAPAVGKLYYQDHICMAMIKQGQKASFLAPVDGTVIEVNSRVQEKPSLIHDDPYGEGWLFRVIPTNIRRSLDNLFYGEDSANWIYGESHRLMNLMESEAGVTVPDGGTFIDDVYSHYPQLGWRRLVQEFLLTSLAREWKKRSA